MAQQIINVGSSANDRTGDTWRDSMIKVNDNFTEVYDFIDSVEIVYVAQESDFPTQDATTITLESNKFYWATATFTTSKNFICQNGSAITCGSKFGPAINFTGTGVMFSFDDANFSIQNANIDAGSSGVIFGGVDTAINNKNFICRNVFCGFCSSVGTITDFATVEIEGLTVPLASSDGLTVNGSALTVTIDRFLIQSTSSTFKGVDIDSIVPSVFKMSQSTILGTSASAYGLSGLASSGNVPAGRTFMVTECEFLGSLTPLENISVNDVRWVFRDNTPIPDTKAVALLSMPTNATPTVVTVSTPTLVLGTWTVERESILDGDTAGRITSLLEKTLDVSIAAVLSVEPASGSNKTIAVYLAKNGTAITNSARTVVASSGTPVSVSLPWIENLDENDYVEIFVENRTDGISLIVSSGIFKAF